MKYRVRTLQKALPFYYFLVLFLTFSLLVSSFSVYYLKDLRTSEYMNLKNLSSSVTSSLEQEISSMSAVSMNIIYSKSIRAGISYLEETNHTSQEIYAKQQEIFSMIFDFIGLQQNIAQVNLYPVNQNALGTGLYTFQKNMKLSDRPWYQESVEKNGFRYMTTPNPLSYYITPAPFADSLPYIALVRLYYDSAHQISGAVEVLQSCSSFFATADDFLLSNQNIRISIADSSGKIIYPLNQEEESNTLYYEQDFEEHTLSSGTIHLIQNENNEKYAVIRTSIPSVGWNVYISEPDSVISSSLIKPILFFIFTLALILILTFGICFMISNRILFPLKQMQTTFESLDLDRLLSSSDNCPQLPSSHYAEIRAFINAFQEMYKKLNHSTALMLQSREQEIKAKEIATHSLMKPHFLYNNLANISIMAEENMNQEIITLTENLCDYLRYTSAAATNKVSIKDEFFYTEKYLLCMKVRYKDRLYYSFSLDPGLEKVVVPKLIVQPLVENALKYAFFKCPPWKLFISSFYENDFWCISVSDNGAGFSDEVKEEVLNNLEKIRQTQDISQMKIGGMGLANVYLRLLLMYGEHVIFRIQNNTTAGTCITIGGKVKNDESSTNV